MYIKKNVLFWFNNHYAARKKIAATRDLITIQHIHARATRNSRWEIINGVIKLKGGII